MKVNIAHTQTELGNYSLLLSTDLFSFYYSEMCRLLSSSEEAAGRLRSSSTDKMNLLGPEMNYASDSTVKLHGGC